VQAQVKRITQILADLGLAADQPSSSLDDTVHLPTVVGQVLAAAHDRLEAKQVVVDNRLPLDLPDILADRAKIARLFQLLVEDELATLSAGDRVELSAQALPATRGQPAGVLIEVKDNGPGLSPDTLRSVFDPFFTRVDNPQELGINLMACYFIVHHHGGRIEVKSDGQKGTSFMITLPLSPQSQPVPSSETELLGKALLNDQLWHKLLAGT
jgi:C4-dicarboxylate-specific signal transduction histidine kinase